jgi:ketosteroid isomerase-like protein
VTDTAWAVLSALQAAVDARDLDALTGLFDEPSVLMGTSGHATDAGQRRAYLSAVVSQPEALRWDWREVIPVLEADGVLAFAALGDIVLSGPEGERRAPIRASLVAVESASGWRLRHFHGSLPSDL